jgi:predicted metalloendopeptidase
MTGNETDMEDQINPDDDFYLLVNGTWIRPCFEFTITIVYDRSR